jgi:hypothetical protein
MNTRLQSAADSRRKPPTSLDDIPVIGKLPPAEAAARLREQGEQQAAEALEALPQEKGVDPKGLFDEIEWPFQNRAWQHTAHTFGFIPPAAPGGGPVAISFAGNMAADESLRGARLTITLNGLRVADYPGSGTHRILFDFYAQNQTANGGEDLHFNATYRAHAGETAAIVGYPIFSGLSVGKAGVMLKCYTVNVQNDGDQALLDMLETDVFKGGLRLISTVQPAIAPLSALALGVTRAMAQRHKNVPVQDFALGLDFGNTPGGARLAQGSYMAVQIPESLTTAWNWNDWGYDSANGQVINKAEPTQLIPYNYIMFGVSKYDDQ